MFGRKKSGVRKVRKFGSDRQILSSGHGSDDEKRLAPSEDGAGQRGFRRGVREIFLTCEEADKGPTDQRGVIANAAAENGMFALERIEHGAECDRIIDRELHLIFHSSKGAQVEGDDDADHGRVWTSTE